MADTPPWTEWLPLENSWRGNNLPDAGGLYRIRAVGQVMLDYIGQTGTGSMTIRKRLGMLRGIYDAVMPLCDPHVAGPGLWALLQDRQTPFKVSVMPLPGVEVAARKGQESLAVSLHRQEHGVSPTINFGRMPLGFTRSSHNNAKLQLAGKVFRGDRSQAPPQDYHRPGIPPQAALGDNCHEASWCGHTWSAWTDALDVLALPPKQANGLYRFRRRGESGLVYVGQGRVAGRIASHLKKGSTAGHSQQRHFDDPASLEVGWVLSGMWFEHQRLELENDLIAAHVLVYGCPPAAQFQG